MAGDTGRNLAHPYDLDNYCVFIWGYRGWDSMSQARGLLFCSDPGIWIQVLQFIEGYWSDCLLCWMNAWEVNSIGKECNWRVPQPAELVTQMSCWITLSQLGWFSACPMGDVRVNLHHLIPHYCTKRETFHWIESEKPDLSSLILLFCLSQLPSLTKSEQAATVGERTVPISRDWERRSYWSALKRDRWGSCVSSPTSLPK